MTLLIAVVVFVAIFTQTLTGFGSALVSMAVLSQILGIQVAAPLVALMAGTLEAILLIRLRSALNLRAVWRMVVASVAGIPIGILALGVVHERAILTVLGVVLVGYSAYALVSPRLPDLQHSVWAYASGFLAGVLGGAYNTAGPPVIIYGNCRRWEPAEFKSNLQGFFLLNDALVIASHAASRHLTSSVWQNYAAALPAIGLGILVGLSLERHINPATFRRVVLWLLIVMGLRLIVS